MSSPAYAYALTWLGKTYFADCTRLSALWSLGNSGWWRWGYLSHYQCWMVPGPILCYEPGVHKKGTVYLFHKDKNEKFVHQNHENWPFWSTIMYMLPLLTCEFLLFCTADQLIVDQEFFWFSKSTSSVVCFDTSFWPVSVQGTNPTCHKTPSINRGLFLPFSPSFCSHCGVLQLVYDAGTTDLSNLYTEIWS